MLYRWLLKSQSDCTCCRMYNAPFLQPPRWPAAADGFTRCKLSSNGDNLGLLKPHQLWRYGQKTWHEFDVFLWLFIKNELKSLTGAKMWSKGGWIFHRKARNMMPCLVKHSFYSINMHQNCSSFRVQTGKSVTMWNYNNTKYNINKAFILFCFSVS